MEECKINKRYIYLSIICSVLPIILCVIFDISLVYAFLLGVFSTSIISIKSGYTKTEIKNIIFKGLADCKSLYVVILLIGATVSVWLSSGVVPSLIYYGLNYLNGVNFLFASFLLISLTSIFMGTAVGTISTIGLAILGLGRGFGIPTHVIVGVIVSGAFLADRISPISGILNLTLSTTNTDYKEFLKSSCYTLIPTIIITAVIYFILGNKYVVVEGTKESIELISTLGSEFFISPYLLLLPIAIIILSVFGVKSTHCMIAGVLVGGFISMLVQDIKLIELLKYILFGFKANTPSSLVNNILVCGGVWSMVSVTFTVIGAIALGTLLEGTGIISYLTKDIINKINNRKQLIIKTGLISGFLTILTCDQTVGIVIPSKLLKSKYHELNINKSTLARCISDTGTIIAPILPWNINALIIGLVTGVSCVAYAPFAVLCFISPIVSLSSSMVNKIQSEGSKEIMGDVD